MIIILTSHSTPNINDIHMIFSSKWVLRKHLHYLNFLLQKYDVSSFAPISAVSYEDLEAFDPSYREELLSLFSYSFPVFDNKCKKYVHWIDEISFDDDLKTMFFCFSSPVIENLRKIKKLFPDEYSELLLFNRATSFNIYKYIKFEIINKKLQTKLPTNYAILRSASGIEENAYEKNTEFKRIILKNALDDIYENLGKKLILSKSGSTLFIYFERKDFWL